MLALWALFLGGQVGQPAQRTTLFLDAAPMNWRSTTLQPDDIEMLSGMVSAVMRSSLGASMRVVVFNLDSEKELARFDSFGQADLSRLRQVLTSTQLVTIDSASLQNGKGPAAFLGDLAARDQAQVVIFAGPTAHAREHVDKAAFAATRSRAFFYLEYRSPLQAGDRNGSDLVSVPVSMGRNANMAGVHEESPTPGKAPTIPATDTIEQFMHKVNGRTMVFSTLEQFGRALDRVAQVSTKK